MHDEPYPIWLEYEDAQLYVTWAMPDGRFEKRERMLLHKFQFGSEPDLLFEYLIFNARGKIVTRRNLLKEKKLTSEINFTRVFMEQVRFNSLLKRLFVKRLRPGEVQLKTKSTILEQDLHLLSNYLTTLPHSPSARHKHTAHFRIPHPPVTD